MNIHLAFVSAQELWLGHKKQRNLPAKVAPFQESRQLFPEEKNNSNNINDDDFDILQANKNNGEYCDAAHQITISIQAAAGWRNRLQIQRGNLRL